MSFQDRANHQINQIDKEVRLISSLQQHAHIPAAALRCPHNRTIALTDLRMQLSRYPVLNNLEKQTSVPKVYAFLGLVGIYFFLVFFNIAGEFLVNFAGFLIPGYFSLEALFSSSKVDDTQVRL